MDGVDLLRCQEMTTLGYFSKQREVPPDLHESRSQGSLAYNLEVSLGPWWHSTVTDEFLDRSAATVCIQINGFILAIQMCCL